MSKNKKNQKNQTPVAASTNEFAQEPANDNVPVIEVVRAEELDPAAFAAAKNEAINAEVNEITATAAAVDAFNAGNAQHANGAPAPDVTPNAEAPAAAPAPEKPRVFHLRLSGEQLTIIETVLIRERDCVTNELADAINIADAVERETFTVEHKAELNHLVELVALCVKSRTAPASNGSVSTVKIFNKYAPVAILNWMGNRDFTIYDAKNALKSFGVEDIEKTTFSRALAKGKDPVKNKVKIVDLLPEEELALFEFYNLAAREAAAEAAAKIDAVKARIQALPTVQQ